MLLVPLLGTDGVLSLFVNKTVAYDQGTHIEGIVIFQIIFNFDFKMSDLKELLPYTHYS